MLSWRNALSRTRCDDRAGESMHKAKVETWTISYLISDLVGLSTHISYTFSSHTEFAKKREENKKKKYCQKVARALESLGYIKG